MGRVNSLKGDESILASITILSIYRRITPMNADNIDERRDDCLDKLDIHEECMNQCRSSIILQYIQQYPESISKVDEQGNLPLHRLLRNQSSTMDVTLMMMEKYPAALQCQNMYGQLPLHVECNYECRSTIISRCVELYPGSLAVADEQGYLPLHRMLWNQSSTIEDALMMIQQYPAALRHHGFHSFYLPIHIECESRCRSAIISKLIELYPQSLSKVDSWGCLPLHFLLGNVSSTVNDALMMIEQHPAALQQRSNILYYPIRNECENQCRPVVMSKCIELCSEALDDGVISILFNKIGRNNFPSYTSMLLILFIARPWKLYDQSSYVEDDIRADPVYRRRILQLLPHNVFTSTHESDYRDLNWQPRAAMMMLLSQMKIQHQSR
jgi:ankyrin repeat protein